VPGQVEDVDDTFHGDDTVTLKRRGDGSEGIATETLRRG